MSEELKGRELGWDDEIEKGADYVLLPEGEYDFTIESFERGRFEGSDKAPACPRAELKVKVETSEGVCIMNESLLLSDILRADGGESTYEEVITMAMIQQAMLGDVKAYQAIMKTVGQTDKSAEDLEEQKIRTDRAKRARDQEVGDADSQDDNIQSFLKAMRPTAEDLQGLFEEDEENAEAEEETGEV